MRTPRSTPRINLRFHTLEFMDVVELTANREGLDLQNWLRRLVHREITNRKFKPYLLRDGVERLITIQLLLEQLLEPSVIAAARHKAKSRITELAKHTEDLS